ncbi:MAG: MGMT family protein, partial [Candidatus Thorarchaeota archaeon]|jgi:methylated-DNA-[protein]-cysteine S-methyltransferase
MKETLGIPRGKTATYGEVAKRAGFPGGARFVGNVMAGNRLDPIVPCHRVVASNGLGGYGPGLGKKIEILTLEGAFAD